MHCTVTNHFGRVSVECRGCDDSKQAAEAKAAQERAETNARVAAAEQEAEAIKMAEKRAIRDAMTARGCLSFVWLAIGAVLITIGVMLDNRVVLATAIAIAAIMLLVLLIWLELTGFFRWLDKPPSSR